MKIEAITLREIQMPLVHFFETSFSRTTHRRILLVTLHCDGIEAWGECVAAEEPFYSPEDIDTAWHATERFLAPAMVAPDFDATHVAPALDASGSTRSYSGIFGRVRGHRMAKAALENAYWNAVAVQRDLPLWKLLGGTQKEIPTGVSIGIQNSVEQLLEKIQIELAAGYQRIKVKCKPGWDIKVFEQIRSRWPKITLSCDANSAYTFDDLKRLKEFDRFDLLMIEQPLWSEDFYFHAKLQQELRTSICLDESIRSCLDATAALESDACRIINIKVGRVGGFSEALAIHDVAQRHQKPVWCGGMLETGIGRAHNIALSTLPNFTLPGDVSASKRYWHEDIVEPAIEVTPGGTIVIRDDVGTGYRVLEDRIEKLTVRKQEIRK